MSKVKGVPHIAFLIRAAGPVGKAAAESLARMCQEEGDDVAAKMILDAIQRPLTDEDRRRMMEPLDLRPSTK